MLGLLISLQAAHVLFLWLHDWVRLGRLNDIAALRRVDTMRRITVTTVLQSLPFTLGLFFSIAYSANGFPGWLWQWLWVSYGALFVGELRAWWWPYMVKLEPDGAARYRELFGGTRAFLPQCNGMVPNTLHCMLHVVTAATLVVLYLI